MEESILKDIQEALKKMMVSAEKIKKYLSAFQSKPDEIFEQIKIKYKTIDERNYKISYDAFLLKSNELDAICRDLNIFLDNIKSLELEDISLQYINFLINEIVNYNWNQMTYLDDYNITNVNKFINRLDNIPITYTQEDHQAVDALNWMIFNYQRHLALLQNKISSIKIFDKIKGIRNNIVMIGANGSGKSTFARNLKGKLSDNTTILSAQHLLIYTKPETISTNNKEMDSVYNFQSSDKLGSDPNLVSLFSNDYNNLISALFIENAIREHNYYTDIEEKKDSILIKAIKIWEEIIIHRKLIYSRNNIDVSTLGGVVYDFNYLSDGEKAVFYYISHVLLAKHDSYIIIDEPESHLHLTICNKLWDILEQERKDCKFIYLTHNLDFATTRNNKVLLWNRKFAPPSEWDVQILKHDEQIPERLLIEIVGSRKNILFCEGEYKTSIDFKLYSILFKNYTVIPVGGHLNVINYCMAYNQNKEIYGREAIGIIDGDCHLPEQVDKWKNNKIHILPMNEIENLLCDEIILTSAIKRFCSKENAVESFKIKFFEELKKDKEHQAVWFVNNMINNMFKDNMLKEKREINSLKDELHNIVSGELVQENYEKRLKELETFIDNQDFDSAIKICDFKGKLIRYIAKEIVDDYEGRIFTHISEDKDLQEKIKTKYFSFVI